MAPSAATDGNQILLGALFTALSYLALTGYEASSRWRQLRLRVSYPTAALASFTAYAMSFTLGFGLITGGTVRYWIYSQAGVSAGKVASLTVIASVTFWIGMGLLIGVALTLQPQAMSYVDHLSSLTNLTIGFGALLALLLYLVWVARGHRRTHIQGLNLELPGLGLSLSQLLLGVADLCSASAVLYFLLPAGHGMSFISFAATYVLACLLGLASNVPGGIGVFEATMLNTVPSPSPEALLASLLLFRVMYYLVPFVLAMALLGAHEIFRRWSSLRDEISHSLEEDPLSRCQRQNKDARSLTGGCADPLLC